MKKNKNENKKKILTYFLKIFSVYFLYFSIFDSMQKCGNNYFTMEGGAAKISANCVQRSIPPLKVAILVRNPHNLTISSSTELFPVFLLWSLSCHNFEGAGKMLENSMSCLLVQDPKYLKANSARCSWAVTELGNIKVSV